MYYDILAQQARLVPPAWRCLLVSACRCARLLVCVCGPGVGAAAAHVPAWPFTFHLTFHLSSTLCTQVDEFAWKNPDFLPVFAAGNDGDKMAKDSSQPTSGTGAPTLLL